jgi:hypothetical protein
MLTGEIKMDIPIYGAEAVISRKGGGKKSGARYGNYTKAVAPHIDWLKEQIEKSGDGAIRIKLSDFAAACGMKMKKVTDGKVVDGTPGLDPTSVGWGFKYSLFHAGISYNMGKVEDGQPVMIMRLKVPGEELPKSLQDKTTSGVTAETDETGEETA